MLRQFFTPERQAFVRFALEIIFCAIVFGIFWLSVVLLSYNPETFASSMAHKQSRLASAPEPRLILIGGSGVIASIDSAMIEKRSGYHPVNMGIFAGAGLRFMFNAVDDSLRAGDTVLLIPEHELVQQPIYGSGYYLLELIHADPSQLRDIFTYHSLTTIAHHTPAWLQNKLAAIYLKRVEPLFYKRELSLSDRLYTIYNVNAYGDINSSIAGDEHLSREKLLSGESGFAGASTDAATMSFIASRIGAWEARGVRVLLSWPATAESLHARHVEAIGERMQEFEERFGDRVVGSPAQLLIPDTMFLDSATHPTMEGRAVYTKRLIPLLLPHLKAQ